MERSKLLSQYSTNQQIIDALNSGDHSVFEMVYRYYFRGLCAFCSRYVPQDEAEEIVQDTMMWLWENRGNLIPELTLKSLLFTIVKNKALNKITHQEVKRKVYDEICSKFEQDFADPDLYSHSELTALYKKSVSNLPKEFREAFELNRVTLLTHKEIALKLDVSPQTVNYRISQALKILRLELKDFLPVFLLLIMQ